MNKLKKILLVEDNAKDRELTLETLDDINLLNEVVAVNDGQEAIDYLLSKNKYADREKGYPAVILLDIKMPKLNGIEVLKFIREEETLRRIPVVMLTSSKEDTDLKECYNLGVNAYVVKPVGYPEFVESVRNVGLFWGIVNELPGIS